jgi:SAM-dependent methyltransferase
MLGRMGRALGDYHHRTIHVPRVARIAAVLAEQLGQADSLLDVGSGDGSLAAALGTCLGAGRAEGVDVLVREPAAVPTRAYDGRRLPFADRSFEVVLLSDVLHHAAEPARVLQESLRVAARVVALKDHLRFGAWSSLVLLAMDHVGNAAPGVAVRGRYWNLSEWFELVDQAGGRLTSLRWPVRVHDLPWRIVTRSAYQFTALVEPRRPRPADEPAEPGGQDGR